MYAKPFVCSNLANSSSGLARQVLEKAELGLPPDCLTYTKGWRGSPGRPRFGDRAMVSPRESLGSKLGARERPAGLMRGGGRGPGLCHLAGLQTHTCSLALTPCLSF